MRGRTTADRPRGRSADRDDLLRTIRALERELERKDRRQQHIIDHYERLLAARERQHMERANEASRWEKLTAILTATR